MGGTQRDYHRRLVFDSVATIYATLNRILGNNTIEASDKGTRYLFMYRYIL